MHLASELPIMLHQKQLLAPLECPIHHHWVVGQLFLVIHMTAAPKLTQFKTLMLIENGQYFAECIWNVFSWMKSIAFPGAHFTNMV